MATNGVPVQEEKVNTDIVTLTRFLTEEQSKHKEATGDFTYVFLANKPDIPPFHNFEDGNSPSLMTEKPLNESNMLIPPLQTSLSRLAILFQIHSLLYPPCHPNKPHRPCRLLEHNWR